jgi:Flp pilus assembly protein TadG
MRRGKPRRRGAAAVEFAVCLPVLFIFLAGLWEVGRMVEVQQVMWNATREAARDASIGQDSLKSVAANLATYLQSAEQSAFPSSHSTSLIAPVISLPSGTTGYTCWDSTANREMFTVSFRDVTNTKVTDPTAMSQLDRYEISVQVPYRSVSWSPLAQITNTSRLNVTVDWVSMVDSPFSITPSLPAQ